MGQEYPLGIQRSQPGEALRSFRAPVLIVKIRGLKIARPSVATKDALSSDHDDPVR